MTGEELRRRRKAAGKSQADLAAFLGITREYVGRMERGAAPIAPRTAIAVTALPGGESTADDLRGQRQLVTRDPMERLVERALIDAGIDYVADRGGAVPEGLDFYLPGSGVFIEVKRFHSDRAADQLARAPNVILLQGEEAVRQFAELLAQRTGRTNEEKFDGQGSTESIARRSGR